MQVSHISDKSCPPGYRFLWALTQDSNNEYIINPYKMKEGQQSA